MSHAAISSLEGLELRSEVITRLKNFGIETISDLAISVPQDLFERCGITDERKDEFAEALFHGLSEESMVANVEWVQKFTNLFYTPNYSFRRLISVYTRSLNTLIKRLENDARVAQME